MKISIFGLGYVGCVTAACLVKAGHEVYGVDVNKDKVEMLNTGRSPVVEKGLEELISVGRREGALYATTDPFEAVFNTEVSLVCVGTPSNGNGSLHLDGIKTVSRQIGEALGRKRSYHCVVFRSTTLPGTVRSVLIPILAQASRRQAHKDFDVCFNPEFLREGSSIADFYCPPFTVIGQETEKGGDTVVQLYDSVEAPVERTTYEVAEMLKYACNSFHALKVTFANEIGALCRRLEIDSHRVMELFTLDRKLNISPAYLKPGFAFGGSCLPKDLRALIYRAKEVDVSMPVLGSVLESNRLHIQRVLDEILRTKQKRIGILGLSFKVGTDDLRESPIVTLVEALIGKGCQIRIYDEEVALAKLFGANKAFIEQEIPHIASLMFDDIDEVIRESQIVVAAKSDEKIKAAIDRSIGSRMLFDLVRLRKDASDASRNYVGVCW
jgi:GDP-mannose 6-dehydrogenase